MSLDQARSVLPLRRLMEQHGDFLPPDRKSNFKCPFCGHKTGNLKEFKGRQWFKCFHPSCPSGTSGSKCAFDEVGYLGWKHGLRSDNGGPGNYSDAAIQYLKTAGVWKEQQYAPSVLPGQRKRKSAPPRPPSDPANLPPKKDAEQSVSSELAASSASNDASASPEEIPAPSGEASLEEKELSDPSAEPTAEEIEQAVPASPGTPRSKSGKRSGGGDTAKAAPQPRRETPRPLLALRAFYAQLTLSDEDRRELLEKRGLPPEASAAFGFKSTPRSNEKILRELASQFSPQELVSAGLWREERGGPVPDSQLFGLGNAGKSKEGKTAWKWTHPILIPYFDERGEVIHLRPHKGGLNVPARLFVARFSKDWVESQKKAPVFQGAVITEGEFKACALCWALENKTACAALPGIQQSRNWNINRQTRDWLEEVGVNKVAVVFDNEEKGNPSLPGFKADKRKRYDAQIYARYLAIILDKDGFESLVSNLPNKWRDEKGKADWDGALARMMREAGATVESGDATWGRISKEVRNAFAAVLRDGRRASELKQVGLFDPEEESIIQNGLERLFYSPQLPCGGEKEIGLADKLKRLSRTTLRDVPGVLSLAEKYQELWGWYYVLKPLKDQTVEKVHTQIREAKKNGEHDLLWFYDVKLRGLPQKVANFRMESFYRVQRIDGASELLVKLVNIHKEETAIVSLDSESFSQPSKFRVWLNNKGGFVWSSGERELQALQLDVAHETAFRNVHQIVAFGWNEESRLWFFNDVAYANGVEIYPDEHGIFWHEGRGYQISKQGKDNQDFRHSRPEMRPGKVLRWRAEGGYELNDSETRDNEREAIAFFFSEFCMAMRDNLGGYEGFMAVGILMAYAAAPEFFNEHKQFPGLWLHGEKGHGKTTVTQWLMEIWGFRNMSSGIGLLRNSSAVGIQICAEQYSNLPIWLDEFRANEIDQDKRAIIHSGFNRELPSKWAADGQMRRIRTSFIVVGESTSGDSATRSRYPHILVSSEKRKGDHKHWFNENRKYFFVFGREALRQRPQFASRVLELFSQWSSGPEMRRVDERAKVVYGVAWAAFTAMCEILGAERTLPKSEMEKFKEFLIGHCALAVEQVQSQVNVNQFWSDFISAFRRGVFGNTLSEYKRFINVQAVQMDHPPMAETKDDQGNYFQGSWKSYRLNIEPNAIVELMRKDFAQQRKVMVLDKSDLREQMSRRPYWSEKNASKPRARFNNVVMPCWVIEVDRHELGYIPTSDDKYTASRYDGEMWIRDEDWMDPRKGELFSIIQAMEKREELP